MQDPAQFFSTGILSLGLGLQILLLAISVAFGIFWWGLYLWIGGRATGIEKATFGGAMRTSLFAAICTIILVGGVFLVFYLQPRFWVSMVALAAAMVVYPVVVVGLIKQGMETTVGRAIGVWAASIGLRTMVAVALLAIAVPVMGLVLSPRSDAPAPVVVTAAPSTDPAPAAVAARPTTSSPATAPAPASASARPATTRVASAPAAPAVPATKTATKTATKSVTKAPATTVAAARPKTATATKTR
jgi:hypothetical protein